MSIEALAKISRYYGSNPDYVIAGGGNTSFKDQDTLCIKGSGMALADAVPAAFVRMDRKALAAIWDKTYPAESDAREKAVLADLLAARKAGEEQKRPSVETMLHDLLPFKYVVHLHPALVNGLTCSKQGKAAMERIFAEEAIWIPSTNPGYILSLKVKKALDGYTAKHGKPAAIIFLQNHGVFAAADSVAGIKDIYRDIMQRLEKNSKRQPDFSNESRKAPAEFAPVLAELAKGKNVRGYTAFLCNTEIAGLVKDRASFRPVSSAFTPDHIVYAGSDPLFTEAKTPGALRDAWKSHVDKTGRPPKIAAIQGLGVFGLGAAEKAANLALELFRDAVKVAVYSESFGGPRFMSQDQIDFINNWEVEAFRSRISS
ncbi:MAG: class II aldolase/adducin family protein [Treponema sp.]|nr:class II aldolase/adducin family protein [Treponema sp.]